MSIDPLWREFAEQDYRAIQALSESGLYGLAAFHAQQVVEKCLKGVIVANTQKLPRVHDLIVLAENSGLVFSSREQQIMEELNTVYTGTRYPGALGGIAQHMLSLADIKNYQNFCESLLQRTK